MNEDLEFHIARLKLEPGEILVLKSDRLLSLDAVTRIRSDLERLLSGSPVMILERGMTLEVITKAQIAEVIKKDGGV